jgi:hypothetical protein
MHVTFSVCTARRLHIYPFFQRERELRFVTVPGPIRCTVWPEAKKKFVLELKKENSRYMIGWHSLFGVPGFIPCPETACPEIVVCICFTI